MPLDAVVTKADNFDRVRLHCRLVVRLDS